MHRPAFVAFTGVDRVDVLPGIVALSQRYPIEWGVLVNASEQGNPLFADESLRSALLSTRHLRLAVHVCGEEARSIAQAGLKSTFDSAGFQRVQVNHGFEGSTALQVAHVREYGRKAGVRVVLQTITSFPEDPSVDWLYDVSFGTGKQPSRWPPLPGSSTFCGYSGGLGPGNIRRSITEMNALDDDIFWIDMESGVRTDGLLDLNKCSSVCEQIFDF